MFDRAEVRAQMGILADQRILLYVGRLAKEKNLGLLFEMAAIAFAQDPNLRLWLVGDGPYRVQAAALARASGVGDRVHFVGEVQRSAVDRYYAAADLFVFPSITETQGLVVQEAMTYGLPAVVVGGGGAGAGVVTGENGWLVPADADAFSEAILRIMGDDELSSRLSEGAVRLVRQYGSDAMAERVVEVYLKAIHRRAPKRLEANIVLA